MIYDNSNLKEVPTAPTNEPVFTYDKTKPVELSPSAPEEKTFNYANTPSQAKPQESEGSMLTGYSPTPPTTNPTEESPADDGPKSPLIEHAADGAGDAPVSYDVPLGGFFDGKEMDAGTLDQHEFKEQLQTARKQLDGVLHEYQVGSGAAREMFSAVDGYIKNPRSPEAMDQERETTMAALELKWGAETSLMISYAQRMLNELERKVPGISDSIVNTGAANNIKLITHLANLGKARKLTGSMLNR